MRLIYCVLFVMFPLFNNFLFNIICAQFDVCFLLCIGFAYTRYARLARRYIHHFQINDEKKKKRKKNSNQSSCSHNDDDDRAKEEKNCERLNELNSTAAIRCGCFQTFCNFFFAALLLLILLIASCFSVRFY